MTSRNLTVYKKQGFFVYFGPAISGPWEIF